MLSQTVHQEPTAFWDETKQSTGKSCALGMGELALLLGKLRNPSARAVTKRYRNPTAN